jgi:hypothetical protein
MTNVYTEKYHQFLDMRCWFTLIYAYKDMIFKVFQSSLHNTRRWEDANLEKKKGIRNLKYTKKKCASNYMSLKRFEVPLVLMAMIYILFHICVFIEIVKLFHCKHLKIISHYWFHLNFWLCYPTTWSLKLCTTHFALTMERLTLLKVTSWMLWRNCFGLRHHRSAEKGTISIPTGKHVDNDIIPSLKTNTDC